MEPSMTTMWISTPAWKETNLSPARKALVSIAAHAVLQWENKTVEAKALQCPVWNVEASEATVL